MYLLTEIFSYMYYIFVLYILKWSLYIFTIELLTKYNIALTTINSNYKFYALVWNCWRSQYQIEHEPWSRILFNSTLNLYMSIIDIVKCCIYQLQANKVSLSSTTIVSLLYKHNELYYLQKFGMQNSNKPLLTS